MKRKKLYSPLSVLLIITVLLSTVLLPGCRSSGMGNGAGASAVPQNPDVYVPAAPSETHSIAPTTLPAESTTVSTKPVVEYIKPAEYPKINVFGTLEAPVLQIPAEDASEETWTAFFYGLLSTYGSWYNMSLTSFYEDPVNMDLFYLFYNGTRYGQPKRTEQENAFAQSLGVDPNVEQRRLPVSEMNTILNIYFGTAFSQYDMTNYERLHYLDETDCYYFWSTGAQCTDVLGIVGYQVLENGDYAVRYMSDMVAYPYGQGEVILHRNGDYFQIVANRIVE